MKSTDMFSEAIRAHLNNLAEKDPLFAVNLKKVNKNIKDCCTYIINEVKKSGRNGFANEEVFGMAVHYYDEDDIKPGAAVNCKVVVNHSMPSGNSAVPSVSAIKEEVKKVVKKHPAIANQPSLF